ncbi:hypothetical protein N7509_005099 [Penicillium cosmopolitanum]|uniref:Uncharacterized protein n=1 Tax=Penicillium cosmopolitanum TaxID=1131564 RepID=A0A9W9W1X6_9EURO|nr:uncharacterized protein N7509_005099 [Penicillium cosmopolitanum]KAJ5396986.1 hypothetical protein N7509_005099 [Penicillium cosmopolitanum]
MHFTRLALAMMTGLTLAAAAPAEQNASAALGCPNGWNICGTCNGSSCKAGAPVSPELAVKEKAVAMEYFAVAAEGLALRPALSKSTRQRKAF